MMFIKALSTSRSNNKFLLYVFISIVTCCFLNIQLYAIGRHERVSTHVHADLSSVYTKEISRQNVYSLHSLKPSLQKLMNYNGNIYAIQKSSSVPPMHGNT